MQVEALSSKHIRIVWTRLGINILLHHHQQHQQHYHPYHRHLISIDHPPLPTSSRIYFIPPQHFLVSIGFRIIRHTTLSLTSLPVILSSSTQLKTLSKCASASLSVTQSASAFTTYMVLINVVQLDALDTQFKNAPFWSATPALLTPDVQWPPMPLRPAIINQHITQVVD